MSPLWFDRTKTTWYFGAIKMLALKIMVEKKTSNEDKWIAAGAGQVHSEEPGPQFHVNLNRAGLMTDNTRLKGHHLPLWNSDLIDIPKFVFSNIQRNLTVHRTASCHYLAEAIHGGDFWIDCCVIRTTACESPGNTPHGSTVYPRPQIQFICKLLKIKAGPWPLKLCGKVQDG